MEGFKPPTSYDISCFTFDVVDHDISEVSTSGISEGLDVNLLLGAATKLVVHIYIYTVYVYIYILYMYIYIYCICIYIYTVYVYIYIRAE